MRDAEETFRDMNEAVVRRVIGDNAVDEIITVGRARIAAEAKEELQKLCDLYEIGIDVNQLIFQDVNPPDTGQALLQRRQRSPPGEGAQDQRGLGRVQPGDPQGPGRGRAGHPRRPRATPRSGSTTPRATPAASPRSTRNTPRRPRSPASASTWRPSTRSCPRSRRSSSWTTSREELLPLLNLNEEVKK